MPDGERGGMVRLGGLWMGRDKNGRQYLSGKLTYSSKLMIFKNSFKKPGSTEPDFIAYIAEYEQPEQEAQPGDLQTAEPDFEQDTDPFGEGAYEPGETTAAPAQPATRPHGSPNIGNGRGRA